MKIEQKNKLKDSIEKEAKNSDFSGVVSLSKGDLPIYSKSFGFRDQVNKIPNDMNTKMGIASGTKIFTALGIGKLIDSGKLTPNTKVGHIDPAYKGFIDEDATIGHLLSHRSGIFDYYDEDEIDDFDNFHVDIPWFKLETPSDYFPLFKNQKMKFKADEKFSYSNGGYVFLGIIIEKISGQSYRDFINDNVLKPAGMVNSGFYALNQLPENTAFGYKEDRKTTNIFNLPIRGGGDGGMFTTAEDLKSFWKNLFSYEILSKELTNEFTKTFSEFNEKSGYGYGIYKRLDDSMFFIVGVDAGVGFDSRYLLNEDLTISVISNISEGEESMVDTILDVLEEN